MPDSVSLPDCTSEDKYCTLSKSKPLRVYFNFTAPHDISAMYGRVHVKLGYVWIKIPTPGNAGDVCQNLVEGKCPLKAGEKASYSIVESLPSYAISGIKTVARIRAVDGNDKSLGCVHISVLVTR